MIISLGRPTNMTFQKKPPQTLVRLSEVEPFVSMHNEVMITVKRSEVACVTVVLTYGTIFPRMYVRTANSLDQMTLRENSLSVC